LPCHFAARVIVSGCLLSELTVIPARLRFGRLESSPSSAAKVSQLWDASGWGQVALIESRPGLNNGRSRGWYWSHPSDTGVDPCTSCLPLPVAGRPVGRASFAILYCIFVNGKFPSIPRWIFYTSEINWMTFTTYSLITTVR